MLGAVIYIVYVCKNILAKNSLIFLDNTPPMPVARGDRGGGGEAGGRGGVDYSSSNPFKMPGVGGGGDKRIEKIIN